MQWKVKERQWKVKDRQWKVKGRQWEVKERQGPTPPQTPQTSRARPPLGSPAQSTASWQAGESTNAVPASRRSSPKLICGGVAEAVSRPRGEGEEVGESEGGKEGGKEDEKDEKDEEDEETVETRKRTKAASRPLRENVPTPAR